MIIKILKEMVYPEEGSDMEKYIAATIEYEQKKKTEKYRKSKEKLTSLNNMELGRKLYFVQCESKIGNSENKQRFQALIDTGAANSLLHTTVVKKLKLGFKPIKMTLSTATGLDDNAVKGIVHLMFDLASEDGKIIRSCTNFIVSSKLNSMESKIGRAHV
mgnify:FL=1